MANPSPACEVKDGSGAYASAAEGVDVTPGNTITIRLSSQADVESWQLSCITTDDTSDKDTVTAALSIDSLTLTATFTAPAAGKAYRFRSQVNQGRSRDNTVQSTYATTFCIYTLVNGRRCAAVDETTEGDAEFGWVKWYNDILRSLPAGVGTTWSGGGGGGGAPGGVTGAVQINGGSGTFAQASGSTWNTGGGFLSLASGTRLQQPYLDSPVLGGTAVFTGTDLVQNGLAQHKIVSAVRSFTHQNNAIVGAGNGYTLVLPNKSINNIVVEANGVPSGMGIGAPAVRFHAGGVYTRRRAVIVDASGQATSTAMEYTYANEFTASGFNFTGYSVGSGLAIVHTGSSFSLALANNPTGCVQWGFTVTVQSTALA
jgi:hypothetical protein